MRKYTGILALVMLSAASTATAEPLYEAKGVPITPHQVGVLGSVLRMVYIQEQMPTSALTTAAMPASPHQMTVLAPRQGEQQADTLRLDPSYGTLINAGH